MGRLETFHFVIKILSPRPIVFLRGVDTSLLESLLELLYTGFIEIAENKLNGFVHLAEDLGVEAMGKSRIKDEEKKNQIKDEEKKNRIKDDKERSQEKDEENKPMENIAVSGGEDYDKRTTAVVVKTEEIPKNMRNKSHKKKKQNASADSATTQETFPCHICGMVLRNGRSMKKHVERHTEKSKKCVTEEGILNEKIKSMMTISAVSLPNLGKARICNVCGKEGPWGDVRKHIEAHHITGVTHTCNFCWRNYKSFSSLASHKSQTHKGET